jgi:phosphoglycolate phosphatase-like HAD superfamily hydrolase
VTPTPMRITVACLDMAGTTVADDGSVIAAFSAAVGQFGLPRATPGYDQALAYVRQTMGQSKIEVFRHILGAEETAQQANAAFEEHYAQSVRAGQVAPLPGAAETLAALRAAGIRVCLATGFSPATRDALLDALGWRSRRPTSAAAARGPTCRSPRCCGYAGERSASWPSREIPAATWSPACGPGPGWWPGC